MRLEASSFSINVPKIY